jgi:hypothetical protein
MLRLHGAVLIAVVLALASCSDDPYGDDLLVTPRPPIATVVISPAAMSLVSGDSGTFSATSTPAGTATWFTTDSSLVTIRPPQSMNRVIVVALDKAGSASICAKFSAALVGCSVVQVTR